jgi:hypothetical protein
MARRLIARLRREERGQSVVELLVAMSIGMATIVAVFGLVDLAMKQTGDTQGRIQANRAGRLALDTITRALRSQVCRDGATPAVAQADGTSITFYADFSDGAPPAYQRIQKRRVRYDATTRRLWEDTWLPTGAAPIAYPATPTRSTVLADGIVPATAGAPIFTYYAYTAGNTTTGTPGTPTQALAAPSTVTQLASIARIGIAYTAQANGSGTSTASEMSLQDQVLVRSTDPNVLNPSPSCTS